MHTMNAAQVKYLFEQEAALLGREDGVPMYRAAALFGEDAVKYVRSLNRQGEYASGYGVGDYTLSVLTFMGFQAAASYYNVRVFQEENRMEA